jgi:hypothetical protein
MHINPPNERSQYRSPLLFTFLCIREIVFKALSDINIVITSTYSKIALCVCAEALSLFSSARSSAN